MIDTVYAPPLKIRTRKIKEIDYPAEDGKPLAETEIHLDEIIALLQLLRHFFRDRDDVYVASNHFIYMTEGDTHDRVAPDIYVVFGVKKIKRRVYKLWEEKRAPSVVFEVSSRKTIRKDLKEKMDTYARLGVKEYYLYDPENKCIAPPLQGNEFIRGAYHPMRPDANGFLTSRVMGVKMKINDVGLIDVFDASNGAKIPRVEQARIDAEEQAARAELKIARANSENERLRLEIERLKSQLKLK